MNVSKKEYRVKFTPTPGAAGTLIEYREVGSETWIIPQNEPNPTTLSEYKLEFDYGKSYYVAASTVGSTCVKKRMIIAVVVPTTTTTTTSTTTLPCCPPGFSLSPDRRFCFKNETANPEIITSGVCLAASKNNGAYSFRGARLYNSPVDIYLSAGSSFISMDSAYWTGTPLGYGNENSPAPSDIESVMNRDGVWIDSDCNGTKDGLSACSILQFTYLITSNQNRRVYIGIGGDNTFKITVNSKLIVQCECGSDGITPLEGPKCATGPGSDSQNASNSNFNFWHIIPVELSAGPNYIVFSAIGDGSVNDALAAIIYQNTDIEIQNAQSDNDLNILFRTGQFKNTTIDIATCPEGFVLDTTGGAGNYICRKITNTDVINC